MKTPGNCSVSGEPCFDVLETWADGHPLAGTPKRLGKAHDTAMCVTLVLTDGTTAYITVHRDYLADLHLHLPAVWRACKERTLFDRKHHLAFGSPDFSPEQAAQMDEYNLKMNDNVPLGVLCVERWLNHGG